jgi:hypothetical protein
MMRVDDVRASQSHEQIGREWMCRVAAPIPKRAQRTQSQTVGLAFDA